MTNKPNALTGPDGEAIPTVTYIDVYASDDTFLMRTTMPVLRVVFNLHGDAVARAEREIHEPGGVSQLHFNNRQNCLGQSRIMVQLAIGPRSNY